jgi:hypothetical protein
MVHCQVGKCLAVNGDSVFVNLSHEFGIGHSQRARACVEALNPQRAEISFFGSAVAVCISTVCLATVWSFPRAPQLPLARSRTFFLLAFAATELVERGMLIWFLAAASVS